MVLAANGEFAFEFARRIRKRAVEIASGNVIRFCVKRFFVDRVLNCKNRGQRFVFDNNFGGCRATRFLRFTNDQSNDLAVV